MTIKTNDLTTRIRMGAITLSAAALFCALPATAQMAGGGGGMQQSSPQAPAGQQPGAQQPGAQPGMMPGAPNSPQMMMDDMFVKKEIQGGMAQLQLGQLAQQKASSDDVKQYAAKMVQDHTKMSSILNQAAQQLHIKPSDKPDGKDKSLVKKLQTSSGQQFDEMYIEAMIKDHKQALKEFKSEAENGQNPSLKQFANQGAQMIQQHLQLAQQLAQAHNLPEDGKVKMKSGE
ncbi:MAG: DUF4142 domain-containing protein [Acidobacteria bacterium]|nr:DUF4142 domain-containing protein [Acidobacteriota bacterium]MBW4044012.1 DUF4142 domain-containing protein [Acidobacteriota bacterium]